MPTIRSAWHWIFGKHLPRPPDPERTVEAGWVPVWQAPMLVDELVTAGIPAVWTEDFGLNPMLYHREAMARIFVTEDRKAEAESLIADVTGLPPAHRPI
jgi:hypothetical protein